MKRLILVALAALMALAEPAAARGAYYYIPVFTWSSPRMPTESTGSYKKIQKVAVLSAIGTDFPFDDDGGMSAKAPRIDISRWAIDDLVATTLRKYLGGRFTLLDTPFDRQALRDLPRDSDRKAALANYLKTLANPGVDAYLVVRPVAKDVPGAAALGLELTHDFRLAIWSNFEIDLIDAHDFSRIAYAEARIKFRDESDIQRPVVVLDGVTPRDVTAGLKPHQADTVRGATQELLARTLVETLRALDFGVALPPLGDHSIAAPAFANRTPTIHTIAVVSAVGNALSFVSPENVTTPGHVQVTPTGEMGLDEAFEAIAREVLQQHYTVKAVPTDRQKLSYFNLIPGHGIPQLPGLMPTQEVDAYAVILKSWTVENRWQGLGAWHWTPLFGSEAAVYADYGIVLVNAATLRVLNGVVGKRAASAGCPQPSRYSTRLPECRMKESLFPRDAAKLSEPAKAELRARLIELMQSSIPEALYDLGLNAPDAPLDGTRAH